MRFAVVEGFLPDGEGVAWAPWAGSSPFTGVLAWDLRTLARKESMRRREESSDGRKE